MGVACGLGDGDAFGGEDVTHAVAFAAIDRERVVGHEVNGHGDEPHLPQPPGAGSVDVVHGSGQGRSETPRRSGMHSSKGRQAPVAPG